MNVQATLSAGLSRLGAFFSPPSRRRFSYLALLFAVAALDYAGSWRQSRTFTFFSALDGKPRIERRYLPRSLNSEEALSRYVSELLLGPSDVESGMLFSKGSFVKSVMIRKGIAYIDLSKDAAIPAESRPDIRSVVASAKADVVRNFPLIKHANIYIEGHEPYASDVSADARIGDSSKNGKSVDK
jgi:hypothetical protein